uniref:Protein FAM136A n=1 Tax=Accipiter nisus TaxID=211598 RepID=A0A8B9RXD9_9AVES
MAEAAQTRVQAAVESAVRGLERDRIRAMQVPGAPGRAGSAPRGENAVAAPSPSLPRPAPCVTHVCAPGRACPPPAPVCMPRTRTPAPHPQPSAPPPPSLPHPADPVSPQGAMFRCSARCCEDDTASMQQVQRCIERCHAPLAQAQAIVTAELERFQDRLSRCTLHCNDKAKDALEAGGAEARVRGQLDACLVACGDDHLRLVPAMAKKMKDSLAALQQ